MYSRFQKNWDNFIIKQSGNMYIQNRTCPLLDEIVSVLLYAIALPKVKFTSFQRAKIM